VGDKCEHSIEGRRHLRGLIVPFLPPPSLLLALQAVEGRSVLWVSDKVAALTKACHE